VALFDLKQYRVRGRVAIAEKTFDIETLDGALVAVATTGLRGFLSGSFTVVEDGNEILALHGAILGRKTTVAAGDRAIGWIQLPIIADADGFELATLIVDEHDTLFQVVAVDGAKLGELVREWRGMIDETINEANTYEVSITPAGESRPGTAELLLAISLLIDDRYPRDRYDSSLSPQSS